MKVLNYLIVFYIFVGIFNMQFALQENNENYIQVIKNKNDQQLYDYVQNIGFKVFGGTKDASTSLKNLLSDDPIIPVLKEDDLMPWEYFLLSFKSWIQLSKFNVKKASEYEGAVNKLLEVSNIDMIGNFSEIINTKPLKKGLFINLVGHNIKSVTAVYLDNYNKYLLPLVKRFPHKSAQEALEAYKRESKNIDFSLNEFFNTYLNILKTNTDKSKERNIVIALTASSILDGDETYEMQQQKATLVINLLEELLNQSKGFFSKKPLSKDQILVAQTIVNDLYSLYPASDTYTSRSIIKLTTSQAIKPPFLLWTSAQILLITLRAYLRKAESL